MAKTTPAKAPVKAKTKAAPEAPAPAAATKAKKPAKASEPSPKETSAAPKETKAKTAKKVKSGAVPKERKAPTRGAEPISDSQLIIHGLAEVVRLGLSAMDPEARATLLAALVKVGGSLAKR